MLNDFFLLVVALSIPFWLLGMATDRMLLPGLPLSTLMTFSPAAAAAILVYRERGARGLRGLLRRSFDVRLHPSWLIAALLLVPAALLLLSRRPRHIKRSSIGRVRY